MFILFNAWFDFLRNYAGRHDDGLFTLNILFISDWIIIDTEYTRYVNS